MTPILISSSLKYSDIRAELMPDVLPDRSEVAKFDQTKLKHVKTTEKVVLPTQDGEAEICYSTATITKFKLTTHDIYIYIYIFPQLRLEHRPLTTSVIRKRKLVQPNSVCVI